MKLGLRIAAAERGVLDPEILDSLPSEQSDREESKSREQGWKERGIPPSGLEGAVFILIALQQVGTALFPKDWNGRIDAPRWSFPLPKDSGAASQEQLLRADELLSRFAKDLFEYRTARGTYEETLPSRPKDPMRRDETIHRRFIPPPWTADEWQLAVKIDSDLRCDAFRSWRMAQVTRRTLAKLLMDGEIQSYARLLAGGDLLSVAKAAWNTQFWWRRFWLGRFDYDDPHNGNAVASHWLLVDSVGLNRFVSIVRGESASQVRATPRAAYRSRFMKLMDELVEDMGITDEKQPLHKSIVARAKELWERNGYGDGMSEHTAKQIATLVRQPESKKGKGKKR